MATAAKKTTQQPKLDVAAALAALETWRARTDQVLLRRLAAKGIVLTRRSAMDCERCNGHGTVAHTRYVEADPQRAVERGVFGQTETIELPCAWCGGCGVSPYTPMALRAQEITAKQAAAQ